MLEIAAGVLLILLLLKLIGTLAGAAFRAYHDASDLPILRKLYRELGSGSK